jgi:adenylate kinase
MSTAEGPKFIISGAPASGKGTQCEFIKKTFNLIHLSTGDMLRHAVENQTSDGLEAKHFMDQGALVPDELIIRIIMARLNESDCRQQGCLLDGFPRTPVQAQALLQTGFQCDLFLQLDVDDNLLVERVIGRRMDPITGKIYHLKYSPPPSDQPEIFDRLIHRSDDTEEKVKHRIAAYHTNLNPILSIFQNSVQRLNGNRNPAQIWQDLEQHLHRSLRYEVIFVLGGPGSGKGTLCERLSQQCGYHHLSAGDLLREELKNSPTSSTADMIRTISSQGGLVPAELVIQLISQAMMKIRHATSASGSGRQQKKFLIDGFPRNEENLIAWYRLMSSSCIIDFVLNLSCTEDVMKERILHRGLTSGRVDDNETTLLKRFQTFLTETQPVLSTYDRLGKLRTVDANFPPSVVLKEAVEIVHSLDLLKPMTRTLAMIKPDSVNERGVVKKILEMIQNTSRLTIIEGKLIHFHPSVVKKFFLDPGWVTDSSSPTTSSEELVTFMTSGPTIILLLEGVDAINSWLKLIGPSDKKLALEVAPRSIRALYGTDDLHNAVHGSNSEFSALQEINFMFSPTGEGVACSTSPANYDPPLDLHGLEEVLGSPSSPSSTSPTAGGQLFSCGGLPLQETYAMIKPLTAHLHRDDILSIIKGQGFLICDQVMTQLSTELAESFYGEHRGKPFFSSLVKYMTSSPIIGLRLQRSGAITGWRLLMGPTDRQRACGERGEDSLRALYGIDGTRNAVHGSDSVQSARRELQFFFSFGHSAASSSSFPSPPRPAGPLIGTGPGAGGGNLSPSRTLLPPLSALSSTPSSTSEGSHQKSPNKKPHRVPAMSRSEAALMQSYNLQEVNPVMGPLLSKMMISRPKNITEFAIHELQKLQEEREERRR